MKFSIQLLLVYAAMQPVLLAAQPESKIAPPVTDDRGILVHQVESSYQAGKTQIRVLRPDTILAGQRYAVIYVLPVEAANQNRYGDGLVEIKRLDLHNKQNTFFIAPTFSHLPWYADHPTDPEIRQESYLLQVVIPFVESTYPVDQHANRRLLLGFSKSGWGAWSLLLRHRDVFGRAAAWDSPMMMNELGKYGTTEIFGTSENFKRYRITELLTANRDPLNPDTLILIGTGNFQKEHEQIHQFMLERQIEHQYRVGELRKHDWHSGWVAQAVEMLLAK